MEMLTSIMNDSTIHLKPKLFLFTVRLFTIAGGLNEYILRLFPFLLSLLSIAVFYLFCKRFLDKISLTFAMGFFCISQPFISYSSELNTYSVDIFISVGMCALFYNFIKQGFLRKHIFIWGGVSLISVWFSYASIVLVVSFWTILLFYLFFHKRFYDLTSLILVVSLSIINIKVLIRQSLMPMLHSVVFQIDKSAIYFSGGNNISEIAAYLGRVLAIFINDSCGLMYPLAIICLASLGLWRMIKQDRIVTSIIMIPCCLIVLAIIFKAYPPLSRTLLFLVPYLYILLAASLGFVIQSKKTMLRMMGILLSVILFIQPLKASAQNIFKDKVVDNREVVEFMRRHYTASDVIVTSEYGFLALDFYSRVLNLRGSFPIEKYSLGNEEMFGYYFWRIKKDLNRTTEIEETQATICKYLIFYPDKDYKKNCKCVDSRVLLRGSDLFVKKDQKVWLFFSHYKPKTKSFILSYFKEHGSLIKSFNGVYASVYLFEV